MLTEESRVDTAMATVNRHVMYSMGIGLLPVPGVDVMALWAQQLYMLKQLGALYGSTFSDEWGRKIIGAFVGGLTPRAIHLHLASWLQAVPVIGHLGSLLAMPAAAGGCTFALGRIFIRHFEAGGTMATFDAAKKRAEFDRYYREGKQRAANQGKQPLTIDAVAVTGHPVTE